MVLEAASGSWSSRKRSFTIYALLLVLGLTLLILNGVHSPYKPAAAIGGRTGGVVHRAIHKEACSGAAACRSNPYVGALQESLEELSNRMDRWLDGIGDHHHKAALKDNLEHNHARFFPFDADMANCTDKACVGGKCGADTSKIVCGLQELPKTKTSSVEPAI